MGATNTAGIYEYDGDDGNLGPVLWNLLSASVTAALTENAFFFKADSLAEQDNLVAEFGPRAFVFRSDVTAGQNLRYTLDGTNWFILDLRETEWTDVALNAGYVAASGQTPQYRRKGDKIEFRGRVTNTGGLMSAGSYNVGTIGAGFRPTRQELRSAPAGGISGSGRVWAETGGSLNVSTPTSSTTYVDISQLNYYL